MKLRRLLFVGIALAALAANARTLRRWYRDEPISNPIYESRNGRYVVVVRQYPIEDFEAVRLDELVEFDKPDWKFPDDGDSDFETAALYEILPDESQRLISVLKIAQSYTEVLVSDSGERIVLRDSPYSPFYPSSDPLVTIYAPDGTIVRSLEPHDLFTDRDADILRTGHHSIDASLDFELANDEVILLSPEDGTTLRIRISDGAVLDEKRDRLQYAAVGVDEMDSDW